MDRFWQNTRRCVGWDVQYFGTIEPQKRGAPHFHAALRGTIPRAELRAITAATYDQVWWPAHNQLVYTGDRLPVWDTRSKGFTDPDTGTPLPSWDQACADITEPAHVVQFGEQVHVKGILSGTEEAGRHIGYLTKYLIKSIHQAAGLDEHATVAQRNHVHRLDAELQITPCSPCCAVCCSTGSSPCESDDSDCLAAVQRRHDAWEGLQNADQFEQLMTTMAARPGQPREVGEDLPEKR